MLRILGATLLLAACGSSSSSPPEPEEHRPEAASCDAGRDTWTVEPVDTGGGYDNYGEPCTDHADCTDGDDGRCSFMSGRGGPYLSCTYTECVTDDDCDGVCDCAGDAEQDHNTCLPPGNCKVDADCGDDYCSPSVTSCGPGWGLLGHFCHTPQDECRSDADCTEGYCAFDEGSEVWACLVGTCVG